ncbi:putative serine family protein [Neofusicoccum parvum UCRNP2]|uniref:Putative serine family protein n=1 Tax=Botryosphaeria parva (strain UCR-NP2) TaxID=1287680 RepID=R1E7Y0_BOTPV|nr:putative serine family protein [Neofusicoccum parvum UCRNP2]
MLTPLADDLRKRGILPPRSENSTVEDIYEEYVTLPLDHFGSDAGTFDNRFWVAESGYQGLGHPIFILDLGEQTGDPNAYGSGGAINRLQETWFKDIVDSFGGMGIAWEHRYYGASSPVNISVDTDPKDLKYLTVEQALADVAVFASNFTRDNYEDVDLTPASTPWIFIGGSYPGIRAALMRELYPEIIYASYASSAPAEAKVDMSVYYEAVWEGMQAYGLGNCSQDIHAAVTYMDKLLDHPDTAAKLKQKFLGYKAEQNSNGDFARYLTSIYSDWQYYGAAGTIGYFCDYIETISSNSTNGTDLVASEDGWAPSRGAAFVVERWASYLEESKCPSNSSASNSTEAAACSDLSGAYEDPDSISWTWQYCTQFGFLQSANLGPHQIVSKYDSLEFERDLCVRQFPTAGDLLPEWPAAKDLNKNLGGWDIRPSNTFWTGGEFDPWRKLSPLSDADWAPQPVLTQEAPACNVSTTSDEIFGYVLPNAEHCFDLDSTEEAFVAQKYFTDALTEWLKCFTPSGGY